MNNKLNSIMLVVLLGLSTLLALYFYIVTDFQDLSVNASKNSGIFLTWCYLLFGIAAIAAIVFPLINMAQNPKGAKNALIGVVALGVVFALGYALASGEESFTIDGILLADSSTSKLSEAGLIAFYIMGAAAIVAVVYAEVSKMLK
ncbi:MAG: hypothetical protein KF732_02450 [Flavobacteriales bacterium]|nr:hypothetical protein [Flavobacteriales bacterium]